MRRNMVQSLIEHGEIRTTIVKAKELRSFAEKIVTLAVDGSLAARQQAEALLTDRSIIPKESQKEYDRMSDTDRERVLRSKSGRRYRKNTTRPGAKFTAESVIWKLFNDVGPRMKRRNEKLNSSGGYTRIIKLADRRLGDAGRIAILQFVDEKDAPRKKLADKTARKRRARVKYNVFAGKPRAAQRGARRSSAPKAAPDAGATAEAKSE